MIPAWNLSPSRFLLNLETDAMSIAWLEFPVPCDDAGNGYVLLRVAWDGRGHFTYERDLDICGGSRPITRARMLEYVEGRVTDPLAD